MLAADAVIALPAPARAVHRGPARRLRTASSRSTSTRASSASPDVFAAGDATAGPIKQGGLATQQADAAAEAIAAEAGAPVTPRPCRRVLRGVVLTGEAPLFLRRDLDDDSAFARPLRGAPPGVSRASCGGRPARSPAATSPASSPAAATRARRSPTARRRSRAATPAALEGQLPRMASAIVAPRRARRRSAMGAQLARGAVAVAQDPAMPSSSRSQPSSRACGASSPASARSARATATAPPRDVGHDGRRGRSGRRATCSRSRSPDGTASAGAARSGGRAPGRRRRARSRRRRASTASITRTSTVPKRGCGRTSHQVRV